MKVKNHEKYLIPLDKLQVNVYSRKEERREQNILKKKKLKLPNLEKELNTKVHVMYKHIVMKENLH